VPALRAIRRALPEHEIALATRAELHALVGLAGVADRVVPTPGLEPLHWADPPPAVAVNLHGCGPQSHAILAALQPSWLVAYALPGQPGPTWDDREHEVDRWCRLVETAGWAADPKDLFLPRPDVPASVRQAVVVHPGAAYASRRWPLDRFAQVVRWLGTQGLSVVVTGTAAERPLAEALAAASGLPASSVLAGRTNLLELAALTASARLVICGDTGVAHLATAYRRPSVLLFGPTPPSQWGPRVPGPHTVLWRGEGRDCHGDPFAREPDAALLEIEVDDVLTAAQQRLVLGSAPPGTTPASSRGPRRGRRRATIPAAPEPG
jgi:Glycosyltransferase family 9 (heptosyltransferase)